MKLKTKISMGYGLISSILLLSILVHSYTRHIYQTDSKKTRIIANEIDDINTLAISVLQLLMPANDYLITGEKEEIKKYELLYADTMNKLEVVSNDINKDIPLYKNLKNNVSEIDQISKQIFSLPRNPDYISKGGSLMYKMDRVGTRTYDLIKDHARTQHIQLEVINQKSEENNKLTNLITIISWTLLMGLGIFIMYVFNHDIRKPIEKLSSGFQGVSHGRWSHVSLNQNDELGDLAKEFNSMIERLGSTYEDLEGEVRKRTHELNELNKRLETMAQTDGLSNVFNYRYFNEKLREEYKRAVRYNRPLSIIMIDIDYFKKYNDTYGHQAGDTAIQIVAKIFKEESRKTDIVARYGGEEFVIISPELDSQAGVKFAEKLRQRVENCEIFQDKKEGIEPLTISMGVAAYPDVNSDPENLLKCADQALYTAKSKGRNRVVLFSKA